jgi:hypothetical protein
VLKEKIMVTAANAWGEKITRCGHIIKQSLCNEAIYEYLSYSTLITTWSAPKSNL